MRNEGRTRNKLSEGQKRDVSIAAWLKWAEPIAYGYLKLTPDQLGRLNLFDFETMLIAYKKAEESRRWETAYWMYWLVNMQSKNKISVKTLMEPFLPKKTRAEIIGERQSFFKNFEQQRKESEKCQQ